MSKVTNPFVLVPDKKLTKQELIVTIRQALIAEHDATAQYTLQAEATDDELVKAVLLEIADEERVHAGELGLLLEYLTGNEDALYEKGRKEVADKAEEILGRNSND